MIEKGVKFCGKDNTTLVTFGTGDVELITGVTEERGTVGLYLSQDNEKPVEEWVKEGVKPSFDSVTNLVALEFTRLESIDMVIECLQELKEEFPKHFSDIPK